MDIDLGVSNTDQKMGEFANAESANDKYWLHLKVIHALKYQTQNVHLNSACKGSCQFSSAWFISKNHKY